MDEKFTKFANFYFVITNKMIRILWTKVTWIHTSLNIFKFTIFCNNHLYIRIKMVWYGISDWTPNIESKLIMVIFVQLIQRNLVCARESSILQFIPSFLFSFFLILLFWQGYWNYLSTSFIVRISSQNFNDGMLQILKTVIYFQIHVILHDRP